MSMTKQFLGKLRSWDIFACLFLAVLPFAYFWRVTIGSEAFGGNDIFTVFLPFRIELTRALAEGRLPLWTPNIESGFPLFAEGQVAALYPLNIIFHRMFPVTLALSYTILFHFAWTGLGMYLFSRSMGLKAGGALLAGLAFGFGGFFQAHLPHLSLSAVASWLPWILFFQNRYSQDESLRNPRALLWLFLSALSIGFQFLAGQPQPAVYNTFAFAIFGVFGPLLRRNSAQGIDSRITWDWIRTIVRSAITTAVPIIVGIAIAAVQILPTAELIELSRRSQEASPSFFSSFSFRPEILPQFISPFSWLAEPEPSVSNQEYWGYVGVMPLLLAIAALWLRRDRSTIFFFLFALGFMSLAFGDSNPFFPLLYNIPVINQFRAPVRLLLYAVFALAFLAGSSFDELQNRLPAGRSSFLAWTLAIGLGAPTIIEIIEKDLQPFSVWINLWNWLPIVLILLSLVLLSLAFKGYPSKSTFGVAALGLVFLDLFAFAPTFSANLDSVLLPTELTQAPLSVNFMQTASTPNRIFSHLSNPRLVPNRPTVYNIQSAQIYSPLAISRNEQYIFYMSAAMLNLLNVSYYVPPPKTRGDEYPEFVQSSIFDPFDNVAIPSIQTSRVEIVSYTDKSENLPDGFLAGELLLKTSADSEITLPMRLGSETADWAFEPLANANRIAHHRPANAISFRGSLLPLAREFRGLKYAAQYNLPAPVQINEVNARSYLPPGRLAIERISLIDPSGHATSLAELTRHNEFTTAFKSQALEVFQNLTVLPRAFIVHQAAIVSDDRVIDRMRNPSFQPDQLVLLSDGEPMDDKAGREHASDLAVIDEYKSDRVSLSVKTDQEGYLVFADSWYPGWQVFVDGQSSQLLRGDYIFRSVFIQPGAHSVVFEYRPQPFYYGAIISILSLVTSGVAAIFIYGRLRRSQR